MNCDDRREQILLYLTDGLDQAERDSLEEHLQEGCPRCLAELSAARETLGWLPLALSPKSPPDSIKHVLMKRVGDKLKEEFGTPGQQDSPASAEPPAEPRTESSRSGPSKRALRRHRQTVFQWLSPVAAAVLAILLTYSIMTVELRDGRERYTQLAEEVSQLKQNLSRSDTQLSELSGLRETIHEVYSMFGSSSSQFIQLQSRQNERSTIARVLLDLKLGLCYFFHDEDIPLERDRRYALMLFADDNGEPIQAAEFTLDGQQHPKRFELQIPDEPKRFTRVSVLRIPDAEQADKDDDGDDSMTEVLFGTFGSAAW